MQDVPLCGTLCHMTRDLTTKSLERGILVLEALAQHGACSLGDLHHATGLPKSTLRRLLAPLRGHHLVRRSIGDQLYRSNIALPLITRPTTTPRVAWLVEIASPHMIELTRRIKWPSELHLRSGTHMRIIESTRALSPFQLRPTTMDMEVSLFGSASGRACLSTLKNDEVVATIRRVGDHPRWGLGRLHTTIDEFIDDLDQIRATGYATRSPRYIGESRPRDKLSVIAVPIHHARAAAAALTVVWPNRHLDVEHFAAGYLSDLSFTAQRISADLAKFSRSRPA